MKKEIVFEILGEGGEICIYRQNNDLGAKFLYQHNEFDPTNEGLDVNINGEYDNFDQPFQLINNQYPWYMLHLEIVHEDFRKFITEKLIEKLNDKSVSAEDLQYSKDDLEHSLNIKLIHSKNRHKQNLNWGCEKTQ